MRRAQWHRLPDDPRSPLAWWWRDARTWGLPILGGFGVLLTTLLSADAAWQPFLVVLVFLGASVPRIVHALWIRHRSALVALAPDPSPVEPFLIEFILSQGEVVTGKDQGIASFVDGWLHVEGLRASFSLRPIDTAKIGFSSAGYDRFELPGGQRVELRPLAATATDRATFQETVRVWHRFSVAPPLGEPLLPPSEIHPSAASRPLTTIFVHVLFVPPVVALFLFFGQWGELRSILLFLIVPAVVAFRNGATALRELSRLKNASLRSLEGREEATSGGASLGGFS